MCFCGHSKNGGGRLRHARDSKARRCSRPAVPNNLMERVCVAVCSRGSLRQNSRRVGCTPYALHDSISKGRESQCSDRSHKPILVGATPTPASISTVNEASVSAQCRSEIATEVAATLKGLVVIEVSTAGLHPAGDGALPSESTIFQKGARPA